MRQSEPNTDDTLKGLEIEVQRTNHDRHRDGQEHQASKDRHGKQQGEQKKSEGENGTKVAVYASLIANILIAISKGVAGVFTGSAAMFAEAAHSTADSVNEVFLLISLHLAKSPPDDVHPFGHGKDRFFWSFVAAVFIFTAGALYSFYRGATTLMHLPEQGKENFLINYAVLGISAIFEGASLVYAVKELFRAAKEEGESPKRFFYRTTNTSLKVPIYENAAALVGLALAAIGVGLHQLTGNGLYDGLASIGIGFVLTYIAWQLGTDSRDLLLGEGLQDDDRQQLLQIMRDTPEVDEVRRLLTMHIGPKQVLLTADLKLQEGLSAERAERVLHNLENDIREKLPHITQSFLEIHTHDSVPEGPSKADEQRPSEPVAVTKSTTGPHPNQSSKQRAA